MGYQKKLKLERLRQQELEEDDFRKHMMDKFAEDERIEQMNAQKRRMKMQEHKREEERKKILAEAAGKLGLAYMPRGVLSSKEDFEMFRAAADKQTCGRGPRLSCGGAGSLSPGGL